MQLCICNRILHDDELLIIFHQLKIVIIMSVWADITSWLYMRSKDLKLILDFILTLFGLSPTVDSRSHSVKWSSSQMNVLWYSFSL
jgi:hypothetical protein